MEKSGLPGAKVRLETIGEGHAGQRLDNFLIAQLKGVPRSLVYRIVRKGEVRVNKGRCKPETKLKVGDVVRIPPVRTAPKSAIPMPGVGLQALLDKSVLYENEELLVVNKPSGIAVHGGSGIQLGLIEAIRKMRPKQKFLELVHRLDRETSGCVMIAKKRIMLTYLQDLLRNDHGIDKRYWALVRGAWPKKYPLVEAPLLKNELLSGERVVRVHREGKPSRTTFKRLHLYERVADVSLVEATPLTGRTHQIRVHALHKGYPLVGDQKYGDVALNKLMKTIGINRLFLHAHYLGIPMPDGQVLVVEAPLPDDLGAALKKL